MCKLSISGLTVQYGSGAGAFTAVRDLSLALPAGSTLGLVGESGCGKSTVARAVVGLIPRTRGGVLLDGEQMVGARGARLKELRRRVQMVFQDPYSSLNPRLPVRELIGEAMRVHRRRNPAEEAAAVKRLLDTVGLDAAAAGRYVHQFSGGQRQRVAIARALAVSPEVLLLDEVTSALDVSVQATILNLLRDLQQELALTYLFISHNLSVIRYMSDTVAVMYLGRLVELSPAEELFRAPRHPYTRALLDAIPRRMAGAHRSVIRLSGDIPDPRRPPSGCPFRTRCPVGPMTYPERTICAAVDPHSLLGTGERQVACHFPLDSVTEGARVK